MLYIMRHGKTGWNAIHKIQGRTDIPLNEEGRVMAQKARTEYGEIHFDLCYCSPLSRAKFHSGNTRKAGAHLFVDQRGKIVLEQWQ